MSIFDLPGRPGKNGTLSTRSQVHGSCPFPRVSTWGGASRHTTVPAHKLLDLKRPQKVGFSKTNCLEKFRHFFALTVVLHPLVHETSWYESPGL